MLTMNNDAIKVKLKSCDYHFLFELQLTFQPTVVITTQFWTTVTERILTIHPPMVKFCVITCYLRDGIVLWELQGQKCQQRVCQHTCWLKGAHPTIEDVEVKRKVCFSGRKTGCTGKRNILVKNCGSFYIYYLHETPKCSWRYCGTK